MAVDTVVMVTLILVAGFTSTILILAMCDVDGDITISHDVNGTSLKAVLKHLKEKKRRRNPGNRRKK